MCMGVKYPAILPIGKKTPILSACTFLSDECLALANFTNSKEERGCVVHKQRQLRRVVHPCFHVAGLVPR